MTRSLTSHDFRPRPVQRAPGTTRRRARRAAALRPLRAIVYGWSSCPSCARARELLGAHSIDFREVLLDGRKDELRRLQETFGARRLPLVLLDGELVAGLEALEAALARE